MNARDKIIEERAQELGKYLSTVPAVTTEDLKALRAAAEKLECDPSFQADYLKSLFVEEMLAAMEEAGVNQSELANRWGKTRQYISKVLGEDRRINFTIGTMCEFAHLLNRRIEIRIGRPSDQGMVEEMERQRIKRDRKKRQRTKPTPVMAR